MGCSVEQGDVGADPVARRSLALTDIDAEAALGDLTAAARTRAVARRAALSAVDLAVEREIFGVSQADEDATFVTWSRRGNLHALWAPVLEIPVGRATRDSPAAYANAFLATHSAAFGIADPRTSFVVESTVADRNPDRSTVTLTQQKDSLPVFASTLLLHLDERDGEVFVTWLTARLVPDSELPKTTASLSGADAVTGAGLDPLGVRDVALGFFDPLLFAAEADGEVRLAWRVAVVEASDERYVFIDASTGRTLHAQSVSRGDVPPELAHREVFSCPDCEDTDLPGVLRYDDVCHGAMSPPEVQCVTPAGCAGGDCYNGTSGTSALLDQNSNTVEDYLYDRHGRLGWDNRTTSWPWMRASSDADEASIDGPVGIPPEPACGAKWRSRYLSTNPAQVTAGSRRYCLDVVAHEFMHGVDESGTAISNTTCSAGLAVSEGLSDVFGEIVEYYDTGTADWVHGTGCPTCTGGVARNSNLGTPQSFSTWCLESNIETPGVCGTSFANELLPQPASWSDYRSDCGGWWNSSIASLTGFLMGRESAAGALSRNGLSVTGVGNVQASHVLYDVLTTRLGGTVSFTDYRSAIYSECAEAGAAIGCYRAADAAGLWTADANVNFNTTAVDFATDFAPSSPVRYAFYSRNDCIFYRTTTNPNGSYGSETVYACFSSFKPNAKISATHQPFFGLIPRTLYICYQNAYGGIWCDRRTATGWAAGPDPGGSNVAGAPSIAFFGGKVHMVYRGTGNVIYHRTLAAGGTSWSAAVDTGWRSATDPDLASSTEDYNAPSNNELWMAFPGSGTNIITLARYNVTTNTWPITNAAEFTQRFGVGLVACSGGGRELIFSKALTASPVQIDFYRGRMHLMANNVGWDTTPSGSPSTLWYASCAPPCEFAQATEVGGCDELPGDWTRLVQQDGAGYPGGSLDNWGNSADTLRLFHRLSGTSAFYRRHKFSE